MTGWWDAKLQAARDGDVKGFLKHLPNALMQQGAEVIRRTPTVRQRAVDASLHTFAVNGDADGIRRLLAPGLLHQGANVNWPNPGMAGRTPLHMAAFNGHIAAVSVLLKAGADFEVTDEGGDTPLHKAAWNGHIEVVEALLKAGADPHFKSLAGKTAFDDDFLARGVATRSDATRAAIAERIRALVPAADGSNQPNQAVQSITPEPTSIPTAGPPATRELDSVQAPPHAAAPTTCGDGMSVAILHAPATAACHAAGSPGLYTGGPVTLPTPSLQGLTGPNLQACVETLMRAGFGSAAQLVSGVMTCDPMVLISASFSLLREVQGAVRQGMYCQARFQRVAARITAMEPALQQLHADLQPPTFNGIPPSVAYSLCQSLLLLTQVILTLKALEAKLQSTGAGLLKRTMNLLQAGGYQAQLDALEAELRDCLTGFQLVLNIATFTQVSQALKARQELQVASWQQQTEADRAHDLQRLEKLVVEAAGGVQELQRQLQEQAVELDGQRVVLEDVLGWLQRMNASSTVIEGHLKSLGGKIDNVQAGVDDVKDQLARLEEVMLQGKKGQQQWCPMDRLPKLAIAASRIDTEGVKEAMEDAASGTFGQVVRAKLDGVSEVAVKVYNLKLRGVKDCKEAIREAVLLSMANHPQVVQCYGLVFDPDSKKQSSIHGSLVMEWVGGGTLYDLMQDEGEDLGLPERVKLALQVVAGVQHLHSKKLVHGDIKPENVLLTERLPSQLVPQAKLCDFGLAKYTSASMVASTAVKQAYTPLYASPERLGNFQRSTQDDVYAFGMLLYFIATCSHPFTHIPSSDLKAAILDGHRPDINAWAADVLDANVAQAEAVHLYCQLAKDCWAADPQLRPDANVVLQRLRAVEDLLAR